MEDTKQHINTLNSPNEHTVFQAAILFTHTTIRCPSVINANRLAH